MTQVAVFCKNPDKAQELVEKLKRGGFAAQAAPPGPEAAAGAGADLFLIDASTDETIAYEAAQAVKSSGTQPVVMILNGRQQMGPELIGKVDDFVIEPFGEAELWLRLKRLAAISAETRPIQIDGLVIHPDTYEALLDGAPLSLTYKEYELLKFLASRPERVWDRQTLLNQIWEYDYFGGTRTVDVHIRRLRSKLGRYGDLIQTVRQVGYKFSKSF